METCQNNACLVKQYNPSENLPESCQYHPGGPVFHEGYKFWSCCAKKKTSDFTEFLGFPGCTKGQHSNIKPIKKEQAQPVLTPTANAKVTSSLLQSGEVGDISEIEIEEEDNETASVFITIKQTPSAIAQYTRFMDSVAEKKKELAIKIGVNRSGDIVLEGSPCNNKGCVQKYNAESVGNIPCVYHPGEAVFHEGLKYWSCCERKTSDFNSFLDQKGCVEGVHHWVNPLDESCEIPTVCRFDYFQGTSDLTMNIYAKNVNYDKSYIQLSQDSLSVHLLFDLNKVFTKQFFFHSQIRPTKTTASLFGTKLELKIVKRHSSNWVSLEKN